MDLKKVAITAAVIAATATNNLGNARSNDATLSLTGNPPVQAVALGTLMQSLGVNAGFACSHYGDDTAHTTTAVAYAGFRAVRINGCGKVNWPRVLDGLRIKALLLVDQPTYSPSLVVERAIAIGTNRLIAIEGPNEPNNLHPIYNGPQPSGWPTCTGKQTSNYWLPVACYQYEIYNTIKGDRRLNGVPVWACSECGGAQNQNTGMQFLTVPTPAPSGVLVPAGTVYADVAVLHNYIPATLRNNQIWNCFSNTNNPPGCDGMYGEYSRTWLKGYNGYATAELPSVPRATTETGIHTGTGHGAVSEDQQGKIFLNMFPTAVKNGWSHVFIYYIRDTGTDSSATSNQGVFHNDWTPKLAATYLHNMTSVLGSLGTIASPGKLPFVVHNKPPTVHDLLLQAANSGSDPVYVAIVWDDRPAGEGSDTVNVDFGQTFGSTQVFDPVQGTSAVETYSNVSNINVTVSDHPFIIVMSSSNTSP